MQKQEKKAAKAAAREEKAAAREEKTSKGRKRKGEKSAEHAVEEVPVKAARSKSAASAAKPKAEASKSKPKEPQVQEPDITDPDTRKTLADQGFEKLKGAGIAELTDNRELGSKKSFSVSARDKLGSTIGVILYSSAFYVYDSIDQEKWPEKLADAGYNVIASSSENAICFY